MGLWDLRTHRWFQAGARDFLLLRNMWTGSGAHPSIHWLLGVKWPGHEALTTAVLVLMVSQTKWHCVTASVRSVVPQRQVSWNASWCMVFPLVQVSVFMGLQNCVHTVPGISLENNLTISSMGPQSPLDMKPDTANLLGSGNFSPTGGGGGGGGPNSPK